jgi:hypothetical protein
MATMQQSRFFFIVAHKWSRLTVYEVDRMRRLQPTVVYNFSSCGWQPAFILDVSTLVLCARVYAVSCGWAVCASARSQPRFGHIVGCADNCLASLKIQRIDGAAMSTVMCVRPQPTAAARRATSGRQGS